MKLMDNTLILGLVAGSYFSTYKLMVPENYIKKLTTPDI
jgi:hypothetical protein